MTEKEAISPVQMIPMSLMILTNLTMNKEGAESAKQKVLPRRNPPKEIGLTMTKGMDPVVMLAVPITVTLEIDREKEPEMATQKEMTTTTTATGMVTATRTTKMFKRK